MTFQDAKKRFSNRTEDYARYRPGYPREVLRLLREVLRLLRVLHAGHRRPR